MKLLVILVLVAAAAAQETATEVTIVDETTPEAFDLTTELITSLVNSEFFQNKLQRLYQLLDLKIRFVHLVRTLVTPQNLMTLRRIVDFVATVCNFISSYLPEPSPDGRVSFLEVLFPLLSFNDQQNPVQRVDRQANFTDDDRQLFEKHKDDVIQVAKLIYNTRN